MDVNENCPDVDTDFVVEVDPMMLLDGCDYDMPMTASYTGSSALSRVKLPSKLSPKQRKINKLSVKTKEHVKSLRRKNHTSTYKKGCTSAMIKQKTVPNETETMQNCTLSDGVPSLEAIVVSANPLDFLECDDSFMPAEEVPEQSESLQHCVKQSESVEAEQSSNHVFQKFCTLIALHLKEPEEQKILKTVKKHYGRAKPDFISSSTFCEMLKIKIKLIQENPLDVFIHIKNIVDELKAFRGKPTIVKVEVSPKKEITSGDEENAVSQNVKVEAKSVKPTPGTSSDTSHLVSKAQSSSEDSVDVERREKCIKRLENLLMELTKRIRKLEQAELDWDDEESCKIEDRLKKRLMLVWKKLCKLKRRSVGTGMAAEKSFKYEGTRYPEVNRKIEKFINRKRIFPDFRDLYKLVSDATKEAGIFLQPEKVHRIAESAFVEVGEKLRNRRTRDHIDSMYDLEAKFSTGLPDPALDDPDLQKKFDESYEMGQEKIDKLIQKFAKEQEGKGLEPVVVEDDEADISESESVNKTADNNSEHNSDSSSVIQIDSENSTEDHENSFTASQLKTASHGSSDDSVYITDDDCEIIED